MLYFIYLSDLRVCLIGQFPSVFLSSHICNTDSFDLFIPGRSFSSSFTCRIPFRTGVTAWSSQGVNYGHSAFEIAYQRWRRKVHADAREFATESNDDELETIIDGEALAEQEGFSDNASERDAGAGYVYTPPLESDG